MSGNFIATSLCRTRAAIPGLFMAAVFAVCGGETVKIPFAGLLTMGAIEELKRGELPDIMKEVNTHPGVYAGVVILATWKMLEPSRGEYDFSVIDAGIEKMKTYNAAHPKKPLQGKLRVFSGVNAPDWVKTIDGGPVTVVDSERNVEIGLFWSASYRAAWKNLQSALAARYDSNPYIREVAISSCCTITAEPFIAPLKKESVASMRAKGFSDAVFREALRGALDDYAPWQLTPLDFTFNMFHATDSGRWVQDPQFTVSLMKEFRARYGKRAVIANHGLQDPLRDAAVPIYEAIRELGPPIAFQTISQKVDFDKAIALGIDYGATEIELWDSVEAGGQAPFTAADCARWAKMLAGKK
jgi:hypothetical protein